MGEFFEGLPVEDQYRVRTYVYAYAERYETQFRQEWTSPMLDACCERLAQQDGLDYLRFCVDPEGRVEDHPRYGEYVQRHRELCGQHGYGALYDRMDIADRLSDPSMKTGGQSADARLPADSGVRKARGTVSDLAPNLDTSVRIRQSVEAELMSAPADTRYATIKEHVAVLKGQAYAETLARPSSEAVTAALEACRAQYLSQKYGSKGSGGSGRGNP